MQAFQASSPKLSRVGSSEPALFLAHGTIAPQNKFAVPALILANAALACGPWLVRLSQSAGHVGPTGSGFWRLALALPILLIASRAVREPVPARWGGVAVIAIIGGLFFAADLATWHIGILHTRLANATLFGNVTALLFPLYGFAIARRWPRPRQALALALAATGAIILLGRSYELSSRNVAGDLLCLGAGLCYTCYLIAIDRVRGRLGPVTTLTLSVAAGIPFLLATVIATADPLWPADWTPLILMTLGSQIVGQGLILYAVGRASPMLVGLMLLVQPVIATLIGWLAYGERPSPIDGVGAVAIALAIVLIREIAPQPSARVS